MKYHDAIKVRYSFDKEPSNDPDDHFFKGHDANIRRIYFNDE